MRISRLDLLCGGCQQAAGSQLVLTPAMGGVMQAGVQLRSRGRTLGVQEVADERGLFEYAGPREPVC